VQERWRYAEDELAPDEGLDIEQLAHDMSRLPELADKSPEEIAEAVFAVFDARPGQGGAIEAAADDDGVLMAEPSLIERADIT
jgi:hypothetical protein